MKRFMARKIHNEELVMALDDVVDTTDCLAGSPQLRSPGLSFDEVDNLLIEVARSYHMDYIVLLDSLKVAQKGFGPDSRFNIIRFLAWKGRT